MVIKTTLSAALTNVVASNISGGTGNPVSSDDLVARTATCSPVSSNEFSGRHSFNGAACSKASKDRAASKRARKARRKNRRQ